MRLAEHVLITTRRAMLAGLAAAPVTEITCAASTAAAPSSAPASSRSNLLGLWHERCRCETERSKFHEFRQPDEFCALENRRLELEDQIIAAEVRSWEDLQGKRELLRWLAGPDGPGGDDHLVLSIMDGIERLCPQIITV